MTSVKLVVKTLGWKHLTGWALFVLALVGWWFWGADWLAKPHTYRVFIVYFAVVIWSSVYHTIALIRFVRMVRHVKRDEWLGLVEPGSTLFAVNQRFRYSVRMVESCVVMAVAVFGLLSVKHPALALNVNYTRLILTYFIGSVAATGYLTIRDLRVIRAFKELDESAYLASSHGQAKRKLEESPDA